MRCYVTDDELGLLERRLVEATGVERLRLMVETAWHLRHRDSLRAQDRAGEALISIDGDAPDTATNRSLRARLGLASGEVQLLQDRIEPASAAAEVACSTFAALADDAGCCDALQLAARVAHARSAYAERGAALERAIEHARRAGDAERVDIVSSRSALYESSQGTEATEARWGSMLPAWAASPVPAVRASANDTMATLAIHKGDFRRAIECYTEAAAALRSTGQRDALIGVTSNIGVAFACLNDYESALEWLQLQLDIARGCGWPRSLAKSLLQAGNGLRHAGQLDAGYALLLEADQVLAGVAGKHVQATKLLYLAEAELDMGHYRQAMTRLVELEAMSANAESVDVHFVCFNVQAKALSALGEPQRAHVAAEQALAIARAQGHPWWTVNALGTLAKIHRTHSLPPPTGTRWPNGALHYLHAALDTAESIPGMLPDADLLADLAEQHAAVADYETAFRFERRAGEARQRDHGELVTSRAIALEVRHKTASAQASAVHHEQLAEAHRRRAEALTQVNVTLDRLGAIGQQITTHLDEEIVFGVLHDHANGLLGTASLAIYLMADDGLHLRLAFDSTRGHSGAPVEVALDDPVDRVAACARSREDALLEGPQGDTAPAAAATTSALLAPLLTDTRLLGVMMVRSAAPGAYGERERLVFRTLCAYGAIALANADAYRRLHATLGALESAQAEVQRKNEWQARMNAEREETLAFLAHDLRAPLNALVYTLPGTADELSLRRTRKYAERALSLTDDFLEIARFGLMSPQTRVPLELSAVVDDACETLRSRALADGKTIDLSLRFGLAVLGHREALLRATCNLIDNALKASPHGGRVRVDLRDRGGRTLLRVIDRGHGMPEAAQRQLRSGSRGAPGSGRLGLAIVTQVAQLHDAQVTFQTSPAGTCVGLSFQPCAAEEAGARSVCSASTCRSHASSESA